nr:cytochrome p450 4725A2 [Polyphagotarsonemus latus]
MFLTIFLIIVIYFVFQYFTKFYYWKQKGIKGPTPLPIFGNVLENFFWSVNEIESFRLKEYGPVYGTYIGTYPLLMVSDPEIGKIVTTVNFNNFTDVNIFKNSQKIFKDSYILKKGQAWKDGRNLITSSFSKKKVKEIFSKIVDAASVSINNVEGLIKSNKQDEVDVKNLSKCFSLDVIAKFVFAVEINSFVDENHPFVVNVKKLTNFKKSKMSLFAILPTSVIDLLRLSVLDIEAVDYLANLCKLIIKQREENKEKKFNDFLDDLLTTINEKNLNVPMNEIIAHCFIFFFAGMETVAMTLSNTLYCLATNQDWQKRLYEDLTKTYTSNEITFENLNDSLLLDSVIKETLRIYPALNRIARVAEQKCDLDNIKLDAGQIVGINIYCMHHNPDLWNEPNKFKPDRFLEEGFMSKVNDFYMPFGAGPRLCVGMRLAIAQVKFLLIKLILNYKIFPTSKTSVPPKFMKNPMALTYSELHLGFEKRN